MSKALWLADLFLSDPDRTVNGVKVYRVFMLDARVLVHYYACQGERDTFFIACVDCRDLERLVQEHGCRALEWAYSCASSAVLEGRPGQGCPPEVGKKVVSKRALGGWVIKLFEWHAVPNTFIEKYRQNPRAAEEEVFRDFEEAADEIERRRRERERERQGQGP